MSQEKVPAGNALQLFSDFNLHGVRYCHWKSNEHLLPGLIGETDLDILVDPADADKAYQLMLQNNYKQVISHPWKRYSAIDDWIGLDSEQMLQTHLHVHFRLLTGLKNVKDQYFDFNEIVLDNTVRHGTFDIRICHPAVETVFLIARAALKKSGFSCTSEVFNQDAKREYSYLKERTNEAELADFANRMFSQKVAGEIVGLFRDPNDITLFRRFRRDLIREERFFQRDSRGRAERLYLFRELLYKCRKLLKRPIKLKKRSTTGGKLISFIGVDGAGKTTLATFFAKWLSWKIDCRYVYLGTGDGKSSLLNRVKKKLAGGKKTDTGLTPQDGASDAGARTERTGLRQRIKRTLANVVCLSNDRYKYRSVRTIFKRINAGEIVITDRYPQMRYEGIYDGMTVKELPGKGILAHYNRYLLKKEEKLYDEMCRFNPDVVVKLVIPAEVSYQRKPCSGKEREIIARKVEITESLHYPGSREYVIDSSKELKETEKEVVSLLWRYV